MNLVPRLLQVGLVALAVAGGSTAALADGTMPGNGSLVVLPDPLLPSAQDPLMPADGTSGFGMLSQKFGFQSGHLDFFSVKPESGSGDFTSLMRGGVGGAGVKYQLKW